MNFVTTVVVRNGPPGYCDSDYEYFFTEEYPTECELKEFERTACHKFFHVRSVQVYVDAVGTQEQRAGGAANGTKNADNETSKAALGREQRP